MNNEHFFNLEAIQDVYRDRYTCLLSCVRSIETTYQTLVPRYENHLDDIEIYLTAIVTPANLYRFTHSYRLLIDTFQHMNHNVLMFQQYGVLILRLNTYRNLMLLFTNLREQSIACMQLVRERTRNNQNNANRNIRLVFALFWMKIKFEEVGDLCAYGRNIIGRLNVMYNLQQTWLQLDFEQSLNLINESNHYEQNFRQLPNDAIQDVIIPHEDNEDNEDNDDDDDDDADYADDVAAINLQPIVVEQFFDDDGDFN